MSAYRTAPPERPEPKPRRWQRIACLLVGHRWLVGRVGSWFLPRRFAGCAAKCERCGERQRDFGDYVDACSDFRLRIDKVARVKR